MYTPVTKSVNYYSKSVVKTTWERHPIPLLKNSALVSFASLLSLWGNFWTFILLLHTKCRCSLRSVWGHFWPFILLLQTKRPCPVFWAAWIVSKIVIDILKAMLYIMLFYYAITGYKGTGQDLQFDKDYVWGQEYQEYFTKLLLWL